MNAPHQEVKVQVQVVVVGAGPVGITAATLLGKYGVRCLVLDRWTDVYPQPRAVHLDDEVYRIIDRLGIAEEFAAVSRPCQGLRLLDPQHRVLAEFDRSEASGIHGYPQANMFDQPVLERLLRDNLQRQPTVTLRGDVEVTGVAQEGHGRVRVDFTDRSTGEHGSVLATYVLGCDGANSVVRTAIGSTLEDLRFQQPWLVLDVETPDDLGQWEGVHQVCDPDRAATYMRIGPTRYRWEFQLLPGETTADFDSPQAIHSLIRPWTGDLPLGDMRLVRAADYTFRAQLADRWRDGNVFLLGDAAHLTPPFIGQGMGAGLRDAMNLSWKLAGVLAGDLPVEVLETYEAERKPHTRVVIRLAKLVGVAMTRGGRAGNLVRRLVAPRLHHVPGIRASVLGSETPALTRSAMVVRPHRRTSLAGRLCPNALLADGRRLDSVVGLGFGVVTADTPSTSQRTSIEGRGGTVVVAAPRTPIREWLDEGRARVAIVRPDGTVMRAGGSLSGVVDSLPRFPSPAALLQQGPIASDAG